MQYICDTNVFDAFRKIDAIDTLFLLDGRLALFSGTITNELVIPTNFGRELVSKGLIPVEINDGDELLQIEFISRYRKLSIHDTIALAMAKNRGLPLLTGDNNLRKAALFEGVDVRGAIWILDELFNKGKLTVGQYRRLLEEFLKKKGRLRLPENEIKKRLGIK